MNAHLRTALALALITPASLAQTTWHVDASGVAPGSGTPADPYTSIKYALDQASTVDGDSLLVAPGTYVEWIHLYKAVDVRSSGGPLVTEITFPNAFPLVTMEASANADLVGFTLRGPAKTFVYQDGGRVIDCIVDGLGASDTGFDMFNGSMVGCTVTRCEIGVRGDDTFDSALRMFGCLVWDNEQDVFDATFTFKVVEYSAGLDNDPKWLGEGPGNLLGDPGMWASGHGDFRLKPGSSAIDAGDPAAPNDPDGSPDDIGALAFDPAYFHGPVIYCTAKPSSGGCLPSISASGVSSASAPVAFDIDAANVVEGTIGILLHAKAPAATPFLGGTLCLAGVIVRTGPQASGTTGTACSGSFHMDFNAYAQASGHPALVPGALVFAQYWFRDVNDPTGFGSGLTDAVRFGVGL